MPTKKKKTVSKKAAPSVTESTTPATVASVNPVPTTVSEPPAGWVAPGTVVARLTGRGYMPATCLGCRRSSVVEQLIRNQ